jgi:tetratricopeptide (TPR) repeat protein
MILRSTFALIALLIILMSTLIASAQDAKSFVDNSPQNFPQDSRKQDAAPIFIMKMINYNLTSLINPLGNFSDSGFSFLFSILKFILILLIFYLVLKPERVTLVSPFDNLDGTYSDEATSNLFISEIQRIMDAEREILTDSNSRLIDFASNNIPSEIQIEKRSDIIMKSRLYSKSQQQAGLKHLNILSSRDFLGSTFSEIGSVTYSGTSLSVGHIFLLVKGYIPYNTIKIIKGSIRKSSSTISIIICLIDRKGTIVFEKKFIGGENDNPEEHIPKLIRSLSFKAAKELESKGRHPSHPSLILGLACLELNELEEAELIFNKLNEIDPLKGTFCLGLVYDAQERHEMALQCFGRVIELDPQDLTSWYNKGSILAKLNRHKEAIADYDKALESNQESTPTWNNKGNAHYVLKEYDRAIECFEKVINLSEKNKLALISKRNRFYWAENYDEVIRCSIKEKDIDEWSAIAWYNRGNAQNSLKKFQEALISYEKAIELNPEFLAAYYNKGTCLALG